MTKYTKFEIRKSSKLHLYGFQLSCVDGSTRNIRTIVVIRAGITAIAISLPVLASVIAFVVYGIHHSLDPATIFTSLTLFNMLRMPLMFFRKLPPLCVVPAVS